MDDRRLRDCGNQGGVHGIGDGKTLPNVEITLPHGERVIFQIASCKLDENSAQAGVVKDAGDDPDVTHGALVLAR